MNEYKSTPKGITTRIYKSQNRCAKIRGHDKPTYTKQELKQWLLRHLNFYELINDWIKSNYDKNKSLSVDRIDNNKSYTFDNIRLLTWKENRANQSKYIREGKLIVKNMPHKKVKQFTMCDEFINEYISVQEAARQTGLNYSNIAQAARGEYKQSGGFKWSYTK